MKNNNPVEDKTEDARISAILSELGRLYPNAKTALKFKGPFQLLIATILSAQCTDKRVNKVTELLFEKYRGPQDFAMAAREELEQDIKECGLFRNKSKSIINTSKLLLEKYDGQVPSTLEELITLPGVGRKTGNVVLSNAFNKPAFAVDTHVYRLAHRLGFSDKKDTFDVEKDLMRTVPKSMWIKAHRWLIRHGRAICRARNPLCNECTLNELCIEFLNNKVTS